MKRLLGAALVGLLAAGCSSPCVKLASKICDCQSTQVDRDNCNADVSARAGAVEITDADNQACAALIDQCECHELNTPQGKEKCGLAR
jgi:hypothetical protein